MEVTPQFKLAPPLPLLMNKPLKTLPPPLTENRRNFSLKMGQKGQRLGPILAVSS